MSYSERQRPTAGATPKPASGSNAVSFDPSKRRADPARRFECVFHHSLDFGP